MATVATFRAVRPRPGLEEALCELPYDVLSTQEAQQAAADRPHSFFQISKPEIGIQGQAPSGARQAHALGRERLERFLSEGWLRRDSEPAFHLYRQVAGRHCQLGLVALASCEEYQSGLIRKHESTRPDKEQDRVAHMEALGAQTGLVFLAYRAVPALQRRLEAFASGPPCVDFHDGDSVRHSAWVIGSAEDQEWIAAQFRAIPRLYIADGHHRIAAAARVARDRGGAGGSGGFVAALYPDHHLRILPYNRHVHDLAGMGAAVLLERIGEVAEVSEAAGPVVPGAERRMGMYLEGRWHHLAFEVDEKAPARERLDVAWLQDRILGPLLGIDDPRTSSRISFVGGSRGTEELEERVDGGGGGVAFSLHPTPMESFMEVADEGQMMPPKSTWFEPKLRDGMFCHLLE